MDTIDPTTPKLFTVTITDNTFTVYIPSYDTTIEGEITETDEELYFDIFYGNPVLNDDFYNQHSDDISQEVLRIFLDNKRTKVRTSPDDKL
jgi:hypothetical protein